MAIMDVRHNVLWLLFLASSVLCGWADAVAAINNQNLLDTALQQYATVAAGWATYITARASWLFWTLSAISLVWTMGQLALQRGEIGDFVREIIFFTVTTGFFWWLLTNGPAFAMDIVNSMRQIAGNASGLGPGLNPSNVADIGFQIFNDTITRVSVLSPVESAVGIIISLGVLLTFALIAVNMLVLMISAWLLAYAGIFILGFGGSRWTTDMAINYYRTVLSLGLQIGTTVLLIGVGYTFALTYQTNMTPGLSIFELGVMLVIAFTLLMLVNKVPPLIGGLAMGGGTGALGHGLSMGSVIGAAAIGAAAIGTAGSAVVAGAMNAAGGASALMEAVKKGAQNVAGGTDVLTGWGSGGGPSCTASAGGPSGGGSGGGSPLAMAMDGVSPSGFVNRSSSSSSFGKAGRVAVDAMANLASGTWQAGKANVQSRADAIRDRIGETFGGQVASAIRHQSSTSESSAEPSFSGDGLSQTKANEGTFDPASEIASFRDRGTSTPKGGPA